MVTMIGHIAQTEPTGTLGGSALASWTPFWSLVVVFVVIVAGLAVVGRPADRPWPFLQPLSRIPNGLTRITGIPGWAAVAIGMALFGLLVAGQGFYADVSWHIALGRDDELMTAPHAGILLGLMMILGGAVLGTLVATFDRVEGAAPRRAADPGRPPSALGAGRSAPSPASLSMRCGTASTAST